MLQEMYDEQNSGLEIDLEPNDDDNAAAIENDNQPVAPIEDDNHDVAAIENEAQVVNPPQIQTHVVAPNIEQINIQTVIRPVRPFSRKREKAKIPDQYASQQATLDDQASRRACSTPIASKDTSAASQSQVETLFL